MKEIVQKFGHNGVFTSCSVGFLSSKREHQIWSFGEANSQSLFDCASITKVWPTAVLISLAFIEGWLQPEHTLESYLPELQGTSAGKHSLQELHNFLVEWKLTLSQQKNLNASELLNKLMATETLPSIKPIYSNATSIFLGRVLEKVSGKRLDELAQEKLFGPLGLTRTGFFPKRIDNKNIIPSERDSWRGRELRGEVHDESAWILQQGGEIPGSAGLFSCVDDLLTLAQWQLESSRSHGSGWEKRNSTWMGESASQSAYGKTGFTGTSVLIDPEKQAAVVILSNATYPHRPIDRQPIDDFRSEVNSQLLSSVS